ncbi:hypothetical protein K3495_g11509 [Podosphaera aphanis]|nr:hypothetical protein K3495_g11509 [Podosphaera aphanis]
MRLPCFYKIHARQRSPGKITLVDIDAHWYYQRRGEQSQLERRILPEPSNVKKQGRPKASKNKLQQKGKRYGLSVSVSVSLARLDPLLYLCKALEKPSNPATPFTVIEDKELSTIAFGIIKGAGGVRELYEAGIVLEIAYMRSLKTR